MFENNKSTYWWSGVASILMSVCFVWIGIALMLDPVERYRGEAFWETAAREPTIQLSWRVAFFIVGIMALAVVPVVSRHIRSSQGEGDGLLNWTILLAYIGSASLAIDSMRGIYLTLGHLIPAYESGDRSYQLAVQLALSGGTDSQGFFQYGGVGLWYMITGFVALRTEKLPKLLSTFFILGGIGYFFTLIFGLTDTFIPGTEIAAQALAALFAGAIIGPAMHIWLGVILLRLAREDAVGVLRPAKAG